MSSVEDYEMAMDLLMLAHDYSIRHQDQRDDWQDSADQRLTDQLHAPVEKQP